MIRYALKCPQDHGFEAWFRSSADYDGQRAAQGVTCPICGSAEVDKQLMAPAVRHPEARPLSAPMSGPVSGPVSGGPMSGGPESGPPVAGAGPEVERALAELRRRIEAHSDYVGMNFAAEARAIHEGEAPARSIYGEAKMEEARRLLEDGVAVAPLPFRPSRRSN